MVFLTRPAMVFRAVPTGGWREPRAPAAERGGSGTAGRALPAGRCSPPPRAGLFGVRRRERGGGRTLPILMPAPRVFSSRGPRHPGSARGTALRGEAVTGSAVSPPCPSGVIAPAVPKERSICPCFCCHFLFLRGSLRLPARSVSARSHLSPAPPAFPRPP